MQLGIPPWHHNSYQIEFDRARVGFVTFRLFDENGAHDCGVQTPARIGEWHHLAGTWDGAMMRLYLDCAVVCSTPFSGRILYVGDRPFIIGGDSDVESGVPSCCYFQGCIDEVRISDRALDPSEFLVSPGGTCTVYAPLGVAQRGSIDVRPNPARTLVTFRLLSPAQGIYDLTVFNAQGRFLWRAPDAELAVGAGHSWVWEVADEHGRLLAAGAYYYALDGPAMRRTGKFIRMR